MFSWLAQNIYTVLICLALAAIVAAIVIKMVKDKKKGRSSCGGNCSCCNMCSSCHKK